MSREEEHHTKCHPLPSVSAQLWHLRTHRTLSVVNRTYSRKGAVPQGKNGTKTGLCCCLQMWTALILQSLSLKKKPNKKTSGIVPLAFHSSQPAEKSQKLLQFITLCLGRVLCFFFFFPKLRVCVSVQQFLQGVSCLPSVTQLFHDVLNWWGIDKTCVFLITV